MNKLLVSLLIVASALPLAALAKPPARLTRAERARLLSANPPAMIRAMAALPASVRAAVGLKLAEPGDRYMATDTGTREDFLRLPSRRLCWAARLSGLYVIHYEMGGRGHSYHILLVRDEPPLPRLVWAAVGERRYRDYPDFLAGLQAGELDDGPNGYH